MKGFKTLYEKFIKALNTCLKRHMRIFYETQRCPKHSNINLTFDDGLVFSHADPNVFCWGFYQVSSSPCNSIISPANVNKHRVP